MYFGHVTLVSDDDEMVTRCLYLWVRVEKKNGWEKGWFGRGMAVKRDGWEEGWLGRGMVGKKDGWEEGWFGRRMVGMKVGLG